MAPTDILLLGLCARYQHPCLGLRCVLANLGELRPRALLLERTLEHGPLALAEVVLAHEPKILGLSVAIWNVELATKLVAVLKTVRPELCIVLGGPEVSYESEQQPICRQADYVVCGEGESLFAELAGAILAGRRPEARILRGQRLPLASLRFPYGEYTEEDLRERFTYVEASRGCAYACAFCLSSLERGVREFPRGPLLRALEELIERGARHFKFVDRTFNLDPSAAEHLLSFFLARPEPDLFLHVELIAELLTPGLRDLLAAMPPGRMQGEVGVQSFNPEALAAINRRQDLPALEESLTWLREHTFVHVHADLLVGLPGEDVQSFAAGYDRLSALGPQELQLGILKRLRGTPLCAIAERRGLVFSPLPPYELLRSDRMSFEEVSHLRHVARINDLVVNSGRFPSTLDLLFRAPSRFEALSQLTTSVMRKAGRTHGIALQRLRDLINRALAEDFGLPGSAIAEARASDERRCERTEPAPRTHRQARHADPPNQG
ncbi:MAG: hypothetical protein A2284_02405 [Deltaproteobacteria bacterium RIFOXYA12_FULL_61_11]|nr:MAG: hypothetical protein A2284_02405 [Deltaproteobacteria bacterium RIFOXYA12_FULL_61_11]